MSDEEQQDQSPTMVVVNGRRKALTNDTVNKKSIIVQFLGVKKLTGDEPDYTVTYMRGPAGKESGELKGGSIVAVRDMIFDVQPAGKKPAKNDDEKDKS